MMDWTTRHVRYIMRLLSARTLLYTEMIPVRAVIYGNPDEHLAFSPEERPLALQLGGGDPERLFQVTKIACSYGYDEINLNIGCPSPRVEAGCFGASLMRNPSLVSECLSAMREAVSNFEQSNMGGAHGNAGPVITAKSRIGVDDQDPQETFPQFVEVIRQSNIPVLIVHARKAILGGISPKHNRIIPPLDYDLVLEIQKMHPDLDVVINGGIETLQAVQGFLQQGFKGAMIGRAVCKTPLSVLAGADRDIYNENVEYAEPMNVLTRLIPYVRTHIEKGVRLPQLIWYTSGLLRGHPMARLWRREIASLCASSGASADDFADFVNLWKVRLEEHSLVSTSV